MVRVTVLPVLALAVIFSACAHADHHAQPPADPSAGPHSVVDVYLNSVWLDLGDLPAVVHHGNTYVPLRRFAEHMGATVTWDAARGRATVTLHGETWHFLPAHGFTRDGRLMVPLRPPMKAAGAVFQWSPSDRRVEVIMPDRPLLGRRVAILVEEGFHDQELDVPRRAVEEKGAVTVLVGAEAGVEYEDYRGQNFIVTSDIAARDAHAAHFDALLIPGGHAPGIMRENEEMLRLVREFNDQRKPIAAICHGPWVMVSAGIVEGKRMTCVGSIADDLRAAGADYRDEALVVDGNLITSRVPGDLEVFSHGLIRALSPPKPLAGKRVAILVEEGFHDQELDFPRQAVIAQGARTVLVGSDKGAVYEDYRGQKFTVTADMAARDARAAGFDALLIPGGRAPGIMRENEEMLRLVREFNDQGKPIAAICHGPWVMVSAGIVEGKRMTCVGGIADDLRAAGAHYVDEGLVVDGNLITSRIPSDLMGFSQGLIDALRGR